MRWSPTVSCLDGAIKSTRAYRKARSVYGCDDERKDAIKKTTHGKVTVVDFSLLG